MKFSSASILSLVTASRLVGIAYGAGVGTFFSYYETGGLGPANWPLLEMDDNQCGGTGGRSGYGQSPVAVPASMECATGMASYEFEGGTCKWTDLSFSMSNNGVKVERKDADACTFGRMRIPGQDLWYEALQFHIHTYSEHSIAGKFFPAELHVVHARSDGEDYAVFGTMIDKSQFDTTHETFEWYLRGWEAVAARQEETCMPGVEQSLRGRDRDRDLQTTTFKTVQDVYECPALGDGNWIQPSSRLLQNGADETTPDTDGTEVEPQEGGTEGGEPTGDGEPTPEVISAEPEVISETPVDAETPTDATATEDTATTTTTTTATTAAGNTSPVSTIPDPSFPDEMPDIYRDLPDPNFGVYTYRGGLTTPPCTEIVNWNLLDQPMFISESQLMRLERLILCYVDPESCREGTVASETGSTSRPPQDLDGRTVNRRCPGGPDEVREDSVPIIDTGDEAPSDDIFMEDDDQYDDTEPKGAASGVVAGATVIGAAVAGAALQLL